MMGTERREARVRPAIHSPDRRSRPEAAGLRVALSLTRGVQQRHVRCEDQTAEPFVPCSFAARESRRDDRQSCWGVP